MMTVRNKNLFHHDPKVLHHKQWKALDYIFSENVLTIYYKKHLFNESAWCRFIYILINFTKTPCFMWSGNWWTRLYYVFVRNELLKISNNKYDNCSMQYHLTFCTCLLPNIICDLINGNEKFSVRYSNGRVVISEVQATLVSSWLSCCSIMKVSMLIFSVQQSRSGPTVSRTSSSSPRKVTRFTPRAWYWSSTAGGSRM